MPKRWNTRKMLIASRTNRNERSGRNDWRRIQIPAFATLRDRLRPSASEDRLAHYGPTTHGAELILAAQFKSGKTTMIINLIRALLDDKPFLDTYNIDPENDLALLDFEMADDEPNQLDEWYRAANIEHDDRLTIIPLRGRPRASTFSMM